jgi:chromosome segregation ATPase
MDMSAVSTMRDQLLRGENQMRILQETHSMREQELAAEISALRASMDSHQTSSSDEKSVGDELSASQNQKITHLEAELASWEGRHDSALASMQASEKQLLATIAEMEAQIAQPVDAGASPEHQELISNLQKEVDEHKAALTDNTARVAQLEEAHASTKAQLDETTRSRDVAATEIQHHKDLIQRLEDQISEHENMVKSHQDGLSLLQANHARQIDELSTTFTADHATKLEEINAQHSGELQSLENELGEARGHLTKIAEQVALALGVDVSVERLQERISKLADDQNALSSEHKKGVELESHIHSLSALNDVVVKELETVKAELAGLLRKSIDGVKLQTENATVSEQLAALKKEMTALENKNKKNSRLVEELEDQLASNFDQHQMAHNRLSTLQTERNAQLETANANHARVLGELETIREDYAALQVCEAL